MLVGLLSILFLVRLLLAILLFIGFWLYCRWLRYLLIDVGWDTGKVLLIRIILATLFLVGCWLYCCSWWEYWPSLVVGWNTGCVVVG